MPSASEPTPNPTPPVILPEGLVVGDYVVDGWLRDGGMAAIYRAHHSVTEVPVALKVQLPNTTHIPEICERFDREADALTRIESPYVVEIHEAGVFEDNRRYFVMEWIKGSDLEELLDNCRNMVQRLPLSRVCRIGHAIAKGLAAVHEQGLVHRDIKPANVMVGRDVEGKAVVKLVDFGIVADLNSETVDADEDVMGTSAYMAPEQYAGEPPEPSLDLFALGVVLYEAISGRSMPPDGWTPETLPLLETIRRRVPGDLAEFVRSCMMSEPAMRPGSASVVAEQLANFSKQLEAAKTPSDQVPVRTGGTAVMARSHMPSGGTEVVFRREHAPSSSGVAYQMSPPEPVKGPAKTEVVATVALEEERASRRWWPALIVLALLVGGVAWALVGGDTSDRVSTEPKSGVSSEALVPEPSVGPTPVDKPPPVEPVSATSLPPAPVGTGGSSSGGGEDPLLSTSSGDRPTPPVEPPKIPDDGDDGASKKPNTDRKKGPTEEECASYRVQAKAAKQIRNWADILEATKGRKKKCWPNKVERLRMRVTAHAELHDYQKCIKEGKSSTDKQVSDTVEHCKRRSL